MSEIKGKYLGDIIATLEQFPREQVVPLGWGRGSAHSYRGFYEDLAFSPRRNVTVGEMLDEARSAVGKTFSGWKGGEYEMDTFVSCWLALSGDSSGDGIGPAMLALMLGAVDGYDDGR